jgi:hypothetical protein
VLPGVRHLPHPRTKSFGEESLVTGVGRIALEEERETRRRHAKLVRDLLIGINDEYKKRYGSPRPRPASSAGRRDVEMEVVG